MSLVVTENKIAVVDYRDPNAAEKFTKSLEAYGFGVLSNHPVKQQLINQTYEAWRAFFESPLAEKNKFEFDKKEHDGFASFELSETAKGHTQKDLKEFYHWYPWARSPESVCKITQELYNALNSLAVQLLSWVEAHMPESIQAQLSMPLGGMIQDSPRTLFRPIYYPPLTGKEPKDAIRAAAHEDIDLLTVLAAATEPGLQVLDKDGHWLDVPTDRNWLIINTGDMLAEATQNFYKATTHRVINPTGGNITKARMSMPLFLHPREEVRLSNRHTAGSYRQERFAELGLL